MTNVAIAVPDIWRGRFRDLIEIASQPITLNGESYTAYLDAEVIGRNTVYRCSHAGRDLCPECADLTQVEAEQLRAHIKRVATRRHAR